VAMTVPSTSAQINYKWLGSLPGMREWIGDRVIQNLSAHDFTIANKDFELTVGVDRNDIMDDQLGVYTPMFQNMAYMAAIHPSQLIYGLLKQGFTQKCYDGQYFFDSDHPVGDGDNVTSVSNFGGGAGDAWFLMDLSRPLKPMIKQVRKKPEFVAMDAPTDENAFTKKQFRYGVDDRKNAGFGLWQLAYGSKDTLDETNFEAAMVAMGQLKNDAGVGLGISPTHLVVPPSKYSAAKKVIKAQFLENGASNTNFEEVEVVKVPWLV
jgi:phage major head subunit gpT-like protein